MVAVFGMLSTYEILDGWSCCRDVGQGRFMTYQGWSDVGTEGHKFIFRVVSIRNSLPSLVVETGSVECFTYFFITLNANF